MKCYLQIANNCYYIPSINKFAKYKNNMMEDELIQYIYKNSSGKERNPFVKTKDAYPVDISLFPSITCSMKCSYCYYSSGELDNSARDLTKKQLDIIIDWLIKNATVRRVIGIDNTIKVTMTGGGEPTNNWDNFIYFIENLKSKAYAKNIDTYFILITNGVLSDNKIDYICRSIDLIQISYDGNSAIQNSNRKLVDGTDSAAYVEQTMGKLSERNKNFCVRSTIKSYDYDKIYDMTMGIFSEYKNAMVYHIEPLQYTGRGSHLQKDSIEDNNVLIREYIRTKMEVLRKFPEKKFYSNLFDYKDIQIVCTSAAGASVIIDNKGYLFPCSERLDAEKASVGYIQDGEISLYKDNFIEEEYKKMLQTECGNCEYFSLCAGGCFSSFKRDSNGKLMNEGKVKCMLIKEFWKMAYEELAKNNEFLDMKLVKEKSLINWDIYSILV